MTWQWPAFQDTGEVDDFDMADWINYTLTQLENDGTAIQADCNCSLWHSTLEGSSPTFDAGFLWSGSLDSVYLSMLGSVATSAAPDGTPYLNLFANAGNMVFTTEP